MWQQFCGFGATPPYSAGRAMAMALSPESAIDGLFNVTAKQ